jgi:hypothetical protein
MATAPRQRARRRQALQAQSAAHPRAQAVTEPLFRDSAFFDPNDLVQVKYEMLRSVERDGRAVVEAAEAFGLSRPVYYVTRELFNREGLPGLLPRKRGPKQPHKLTEAGRLSARLANCLPSLGPRRGEGQLCGVLPPLRFI